jgi:sugar lactone lactonase YvrE/phosphodiesterase/alkaline phosphatase D-like protein
VTARAGGSVTGRLASTVSMGVAAQGQRGEVRPSRARARALSLAAVLCVCLGLLASATAASALKPDASRFSFKESSLTPHQRAAFRFAKKHHGLPSGIGVPSWASKPGQHPYFTPTPRALGVLNRSARGEAGGASALPAIAPFGATTQNPAGLSEIAGGFEPGGRSAAGLGREPGLAFGEKLGKRGPHEPPIRYLGGLVQHEAALHVVFWGSNWESESNKAAREQLVHYLEGLTGSAEQGILTDYFDPTGRISSRVSVTSMVDSRVAAPQNVDEVTIEQEAKYAQALLGGASIEGQIEVITAPGTTYAPGFTGFCAYHDVDSEGTIYSFVPWEGDEPFAHEDLCQDYYGRGNAADATNVMLSHEYAESATDPLWDSQPGWRSLEGGGGEIGDLCATQGDRLENGSYVQGWWDDNQNRCSNSDPHPPEVLAISEAATSITPTTATLDGTVNPESAATTYHFEYGPTTSYGVRAPANEAEDASAGSGRTNVKVSQPISGLQLEQVYHYRLVATNSSGTTYGEDRTVTPSHWSIQTPPRQASFGESWFNGVSCTTGPFCLAVGYYYDESNSPRNQALSYELSGGKWVQRPVTAEAGQEAELAGVSCTSSAACTAVGSWGAVPVIDRWNGTGWVAQEVPASGNPETVLTGVSCISASECIAVGGSGKGKNVEESSYSLLWRGGKWVAVAAPVPPEAVVSTLESISCTSSTFCAAVGVDWTKTSSIRPFTAIWNGTSWRFVQSARHEGTGSNEEGTIFGVSCTSPEFCEAVGRFHYAPHIEVWNGSSWSEQTPAEELDSEAGYLRGVSCTSPSSCSAVGAGWSTAPESDAVGLTLEEQWNGTSWVEEKTSRENERSFNELFSVSCLQSVGCTAVGFSKFGFDQNLIETRREPPALAGSFGSAGAGSGQLSGPRDVAVDGSGDVWVADSQNNRFDEFSSSGSFIKAVGWGVADGNAQLETCASGCKAGIAGSGAGQLSAPAGVAVVGASVWVLEAGNDRLEQFSLAGEYVRQISTAHDPVALTVDAGGNLWVSSEAYGLVEEFSPSTGAQLEHFYADYEGISGIAVDPQGNVWVATNHARIDEYSATGQFKLTFGWGVQNGEEKLESCSKECREGIPGSHNGQLSLYAAWLGIANGVLWVSDTNNDRVQGFSLTGEYLTQFGTPGSGAGQFIAPEGIALDGGLMYIADTSNNRIDDWAVSERLAPTVETLPASPVSQSTATLHSTVNPNGNEVTECVFEYGTTTSYGHSVSCSALPGAGESTVSVSAALTGLAGATVYHFRIAAANAIGTSYGSDATFMTYGPPVVETKAASEISSSSATLNASVNPNGPEVSSCTFEYGPTTSYGKSAPCAPSPGSGQSPVAVSASIGALTARTTYHFRVVATNSLGSSYSSDRKFVAFFTAKNAGSFGSAGTGSGQLNGPHGVAVDGSGDVWVADSQNNRIDEFSSSGSFMKAVGWGVRDGAEHLETCTESCRTGLTGSGNGEFGSAGAYGLRIGALAANGSDVWVVDGGNERVEEFTTSGEFVQAIGTLVGPEGIAVNSSGDVWVSSYGYGALQEFSPTGSEVHPFTLTYEVVRGLSVDSQGNLWVAVANLNRVEEYSPEGKFEMAFGWGVQNGEEKLESCTSECKSGIAGSGEGQLNNPSSVVVDGVNTLWVTDAGNDRVQGFTLSGEYLTQFGTPGSGAGQLSNPQAIAAATGVLYIADTANNRIDDWAVPKAQAPTDVTENATAITQTSATLNGTVDPNESKVTECVFEYGTSTSYGQSVPCSPSPGSGTSPVAVSAAVTGLSTHTTYHFRIHSSNEGGTAYGQDGTFKTLRYPPVVETKAASSVTQTTATLNATVNPNGGEATECKLEYGTSTSYGKTASCSPSPGSGESPVAVSAAVTLLTANTTYHVRVVATNAGGTGSGSDVAFKTLPNAPTAVTKAATSITQTTATLNAMVNPNGSEVTSCKLEYGTTSSYGQSASCSPSPGSGESPVAVSAQITGLTGNTTYHFRISATNAGGTGVGSDETFKTLPNAPTVVTKAASAILQTAATLNATVNPNGVTVSKCEFEYGTTTSYGKTATCTPSPGSGTSPVAVSARVTGLTANTTYHFRISATNSQGTGKGSDETLKTLQAPSFTSNIGSSGSGAGQVKGPAGVALDSKGNVWVADSANNRVDEFSSTGTFTKAFGWGVSNGKSEAQTCTTSCKAGLAGSGNGEFKKPWGIAMAPTGEILVSDVENNRVQEFSAEGKYVRQFGAKGTGNGQFSEPQGLAALSGGNVWVADAANNRVEEFSSTGTFITQVGSLSHPQGIAVDSSSDVWVVDSRNSRVEELSSSGTFLATFGWGVTNGKSELQRCTSSCKAGIAGSGNGQFKEPTGVAVDSQGELWVVDGANSRVEEFSPGGEFIIAFGAAGSGSGQFSKPWGIGLAGGSAYVADNGNNRLQRWAVAE